MSFDIVCESCGAASGHSVGICPFCKSALANVKNESSTTFDALADSYKAGNTDLAVIQVNKILEDKATVTKNIDLLILCVKVLLEIEAPKSRLSSLLAEALLVHPQNKELKNYYLICEARNKLRAGDENQFERMMIELLKHDSNNVHANFVWGTHLFWTKDNPQQALKYIEKCVRTHTNFKRAWGCLGAIYEKLGNKHLSHQAFEKFKALETNSVVKDMISKMAA